MLLNPYEVECLTRGEKKRTSPVCWSDGVLAVSGRWVTGEVLSGWTITHVPSGLTIDSLLPKDVGAHDVADLIAFAKHMALLGGWRTVTAKKLAEDKSLRVRYRAHAATWSSSKAEG